MSWQELGKRIAQAWEVQRLPQGELAALLEVDRTAISKMETGQRAVSTPEIARIAEALHRSVTWFLREPPPPVGGLNRRSGSPMVGAMEPPHQQEHRPAMRAVRAALVVLTVAAVIGMGVLWGRAKRGGKLPAQEAAELELEVTANELATAYAYGKDEADRRYLGQWLIVSGTVDSVERGPDKVILRALDSLIGVACGFEAGWGEQLARLRRWDDVVVRCRGKGMVLTTPLLEGCALQSIQR